MHGRRRDIQLINDLDFVSPFLYSERMGNTEPSNNLINATYLALNLTAMQELYDLASPSNPFPGQRNGARKEMAKILSQYLVQRARS